MRKREGRPSSSRVHARVWANSLDRSGTMADSALPLHFPAGGRDDHVFLLKQLTCRRKQSKWSDMGEVSGKCPASICVEP
jgi:hypothetical protein